MLCPEPLRDIAETGLAVGAVIGKHKMAKHFDIKVGITYLTWRRQTDNIEREARLDGKATKRNQDGLPVMSFTDLIDHLGTLARTTVAARCAPA
jgi:phosphoribulokinase